MTRSGQENAPRLRVETPADYRFLETISTGIAAIMSGVSGPDDIAAATYNIQLAVQEACTNIVGHSYEGRDDGRIEVVACIEPSPRRLVVDLYDDGTHFDPASVPRPTLEVAQTHGYGLFLIETLMDEMHYGLEEGRNHWQLVKYL